MTPQPTIILQGIDLAQHYDLLKQAVREVLAENKATATAVSEADALPLEVPAAQAARFCGYKTGKSLAQFHHDGLTPMRNGKRLFYAKQQVIDLKKRIYNLK